MTNRFCNILALAAALWAVFILIFCAVNGGKYDSGLMLAAIVALPLLAVRYVISGRVV